MWSSKGEKITFISRDNSRRSFRNLRDNLKCSSSVFENQIMILSVVSAKELDNVS